MLRRLATILLGLALVVLTAMVAMLGTEPGTRAMLALGARLAGDRLHYASVEGTLPRGLELTGVRWQDGAVSLEAQRLALAVDLSRLFGGLLHVREITLAAPRLALAAGEAEPAEPPDGQATGAFGLPLALRVDAVKITDLQVRQGERALAVESITGGLRLSRSGRLRLADWRARAADLELSAAGAIALNAPHASDLTLALGGRDPAGRPLDLEARLLGDAEALSVALESGAPYAVSLDLRLRDLLASPAGRLDAELDLRDLQALAGEAAGALQASGRLRGDFALEDASALDIELSLQAGEHGRWQLDSRLTATPARSVRLAALAVTGPAGARLEGEGALLGPGFDPDGLDLAIDWRALASPALTALSSPEGRLRLRLDQVLRAELDTRLAPAGRPPFDLEATVDKLADGVRIRTLAVDSAHGSASVSGRVALAAGGELSLRGDWQGLGQGLALPVSSPGGRFTVTGTREAYRVTVTGDLAFADARAGSVNLEARGDPGGLNSVSVLAGAGETQLQATGFLQWRPVPTWNFVLSGQHLDPALLAAHWPGQLELEATLDGRAADTGLRWRVRLDRLAGRLRELPVSASGEARAVPGRIEIDSLVLASGASRLEADGAMAGGEALRWSLRSADLGELWPAASGSLEGEGVLVGGLQATLLQARLRGEGIAAAGQRAERLELDVEADLQPGGRLDGVLTGRGLQLAGQGIAALDATVEGTTEQHDIALNARGEAFSAELAASGGLDAGSTWDGQLSAGELEHAGFPWRLEGPAPITLGAAQRRLGEQCWAGRAGRICLQGRQQAEGGWALAAHSDRIALDAFSSPMLELAGELDALALEAAGQGPRLDRLEARVGAADTEVTLRRRGQEPMALALASVVLSGDAGAGGGRFELRAQPDIAGADALTVDLTMPPAPWDLTRLDTLTLTGSAGLRLERLTVLEKLTSELEELEGRAELAAQIGGTLAAPQVTGSVALESAAAFVPRLGLRLESEGLSADIDAGGGFSARGDLRSGEGSVRLEADGRLGEAGVSATARLAGERLQVINLPDAVAAVSPDVTLTLEPGAAELRGVVRVPSARITPEEIRGGATTVSEDVVVVDAETERGGGGLDMTSDVVVVVGDDVRFAAMGFATRITGAVRVQDAPGQATRASGELRLVGGAYTAYGQDLQVESGRIVYAGGPVDDPGIDATAVRTVGGVRAGIKVSGRLRDPVISLFSSPSMDDNDILSYILLGRPLDGASQSDANKLMSAATSMGLKRGEMLSQGIASKFGIDELSVSGSPQEGQLNLTVGKYLTPRLYIGYGVGLLEPSNTVLMRYNLFDNWQVEAETGDKTGADILYTIER